MDEEVKPSPPHSGRWQPGQSGNPKGRPRGKPYLDALYRIQFKLGVESLDEIAKAHWARAMTGDMSAIKELADRMDGKVPTPVGGSDELGPIHVTGIATGVVREGDE